MDNTGDDSSSIASVESPCFDLTSFESMWPASAFLFVFFCVFRALCTVELIAEDRSRSALPPVNDTSIIVDNSGDSSSASSASPASFVPERRLGGDGLSRTDASCFFAPRAANGEDDVTWSVVSAVHFVFDRVLRSLSVLDKSCCNAAVRLVAAAPSTAITDRRRPLPGASAGLSPISSSTDRSKGTDERRTFGGSLTTLLSPALAKLRASPSSRLLFVDGVVRTPVAGGDTIVGPGLSVVSWEGIDSAGGLAVSGRDGKRSNEASCSWCRCAPRMRCCMRSSRPVYC